jgi:hypothetical protein
MNERIRRKNKERDESLRRRIGIIKKREIEINESSYHQKTGTEFEFLTIFTFTDAM